MGPWSGWRCPAGDAGSAYHWKDSRSTGAGGGCCSTSTRTRVPYRACLDSGMARVRADGAGRRHLVAGVDIGRVISVRPLSGVSSVHSSASLSRYPAQRPAHPTEAAPLVRHRGPRWSGTRGHGPSVLIHVHVLCCGSDLCVGSVRHKLAT